MNPVSRRLLATLVLAGIGWVWGVPLHAQEAPDPGAEPLLAEPLRDPDFGEAVAAVVVTTADRRAVRCGWRCPGSRPRRRRSTRRQSRPRAACSSDPPQGFWLQAGGTQHRIQHQLRRRMSRDFGHALGPTEDFRFAITQYIVQAAGGGFEGSQPGERRETQLLF